MHYYVCSSQLLANLGKWEEVKTHLVIMFAESFLCKLCQWGEGRDDVMHYIYIQLLLVVWTCDRRHYVYYGNCSISLSSSTYRFKPSFTLVAGDKFRSFIIVVANSANSTLQSLTLIASS